MQILMDNAHTTISKGESWQMFNDISPHYDYLNHLLSFGCDIWWRKKIVDHLSDGTELEILDLATGTADVLLTIFNQTNRIRKACGIDLAEKMIEIGRRKIEKKDLNDRISLQLGDANKIPFEAQSFDNVIMAFGIRNVEDPLVVLKEMSRVLKTGGKAIILEFSLPHSPLLRTMHLFYLRTVVPVVGSLFSGHKQAYKYLNSTIEAFPYGEVFCSMLSQSGFDHARAIPLLGGIAAIYTGIKE